MRKVNILAQVLCQDQQKLLRNYTIYYYLHIGLSSVHSNNLMLDLSPNVPIDNLDCYNFYSNSITPMVPVVAISDGQVWFGPVLLKYRTLDQTIGFSSFKSRYIMGNKHLGSIINNILYGSVQ